MTGYEPSYFCQGYVAIVPKVPTEKNSFSSPILLSYLPNTNECMK